MFKSTTSTVLLLAAWGGWEHGAVDATAVTAATSMAPVHTSAQVIGITRPSIISTVGEECERQSEYVECSSRIVNGNDVCPEFRYEHLVPILFSGSQSCGGTLYNSKYVITAAHCHEGPQSNVQVSYHRHDLSKSAEEEDGQTVNVESYWIHPDYDDVTYNWDVAVLKLEGDGVLNISQSPLVRLDDGTYLSDGATFSVAGWGALASGSYGPDVAQEVDVPYIPYDDCVGNLSSYGHHMISEENMICAGNLAEGGIDSCQGDSGGPLFVDCESDKTVLVGVVSWGIGCADAGYPGVYTKVAAVRDFIFDVLDGTTTAEMKSVVHGSFSYGYYDFDYYSYYYVSWYSYNSDDSNATTAASVNTTSSSDAGGSTRNTVENDVTTAAGGTVNTGGSATTDGDEVSGPNPTTESTAESTTSTSPTTSTPVTGASANSIKMVALATAFWTYMAGQ